MGLLPLYRSIITMHMSSNQISNVMYATIYVTLFAVALAMVLKAIVPLISAIPEEFALPAPVEEEVIVGGEDVWLPQH